MRPVDRLGIVGLMLVAFGAAIVMTLQGSMPLWAKWLIGPLLWYGGIAVLLAWALMRAFPLRRQVVEEEDEVVEAKPEKLPFFASNFLEHDSENVA
jgi:hypothetical protein